MTCACVHVTCACVHVVCACVHVACVCVHVACACVHVACACVHVACTCVHVTCACVHVTCTCACVHVTCCLCVLVHVICMCMCSCVTTQYLLSLLVNPTVSSDHYQLNEMKWCIRCSSFSVFFQIDFHEKVIIILLKMLVVNFQFFLRCQLFGNHSQSLL